MQLAAYFARKNRQNVAKLFQNYSWFGVSLLWATAWTEQNTAWPCPAAVASSCERDQEQRKNCFLISVTLQLCPRAVYQQYLPPYSLPLSDKSCLVVENPHMPRIGYQLKISNLV
jgi:hypothetical protein